MQSLIAVLVAVVGYGVVALAVPPTAGADECPATRSISRTQLDADRKCSRHMKDGSATAGAS